jgi:hypothetical protein
MVHGQNLSSALSEPEFVSGLFFETPHEKRYRYKVPNHKVPNQKVPDHKVLNYTLIFEGSVER